MIYYLRVPDEGFIRFDASKGNLTFTDNFYLMLQFYFESELQQYVNEVLPGIEYEVWGIAPDIKL